MRPYTNQLAVIAVVVMLALSGCAGWGTDGPADQDVEENTSATENGTDADSENDTDVDGDSSEDTSGESNSGDTSDGSNSGDTSSGSNSGDTSSESNDMDTSDDSNGEDTSSGDGDGDDGDDDRPVHRLAVHAGSEGEPVEGVDVTIERHSDGATTTRTTGPDGIVEFPVYPGEYTVEAVDPRGYADEQTVVVQGDVGIVMEGIEPNNPEQHSLTVHVVDESGAPVSGAEVLGAGGVLGGGDAPYLTPTVTGPDGVAFFEGEAYQGHTYELEVYASGYELAIMDVVIDGDTSTTVTLTPETDGGNSRGSTNVSNGGSNQVNTPVSNDSNQSEVPA